MNFSTEQEFDEATFEVNVTSFIDVLFTLLLFFMVTTSFVEPQGLDIQLPAAQSGRSTPSVVQELIVTVREDGEILLNDAPLSIDQLGARLQAEKDGGKSASLVIRADRATAHGSVTEILDLARMNRIEQIAIATVPKR